MSIDEKGKLSDRAIKTGRPEVREPVGPEPGIALSRIPER